jgi:disulfide bond formation protein DsbB
MTNMDKARALALLVPALLLAGALGSEYIGGLYPCDMCHWQRWGHYAALGFALLSRLLRGQPNISRVMLWLAIAGIATSGAIGVYHSGVEAGIFEGLTTCTNRGASLEEILSAPLIRCDEVQWSFLAISMAGWNAIVSLGFACLILWLLLRKEKVTA